MQITKSFGVMGRNDARLIRRDSFLIGLFAYIFIISLLMRFALPWIADQVAATPDVTFDITALYPLIVGFIGLFLSAVLGGMIIAFIVLDERDDHTLTAMLVTPMPMSHYLGYRILIPTLMAFSAAMIMILVMNVALVELWQLIVIALIAALNGAVIMLFIGTFAQNKVQGFAMLKIVNSVGISLFAAWFLPAPWEYLFGIFPPYWAAKAYWMAQAGDTSWWLPAIIGLAYSIGLIAFLLRRFHKVAYS